MPMEARGVAPPGAGGPQHKQSMLHLHWKPPKICYHTYDEFLASVNNKCHELSGLHMAELFSQLGSRNPRVRNHQALCLFPGAHRGCAAASPCGTGQHTALGL